MKKFPNKFDDRIDNRKIVIYSYKKAVRLLYPLLFCVLTGVIDFQIFAEGIG
jgi:hypothetical protein